jgi:hypothetical protein
MARGIPIVVVRPPGVVRRDGFLEEHQDMSLGGEFDDARRILAVLVADQRTKSAGLRATAEAMVSSWSFDRTRELCSILDSEPSLELDVLARLQIAAQSNRQVSEAVYGGVGASLSVPAFIERLVRRHSPSPPPAVDEEPF